MCPARDDVSPTHIYVNDRRLIVKQVKRYSISEARCYNNVVSAVSIFFFILKMNKKCISCIQLQVFLRVFGCRANVLIKIEYNLISAVHKNVSWKQEQNYKHFSLSR